MTKIREQLTSDLEAINKRVANPDRKSNTGNLLYRAFVLQTLASLAESGLKATWKSMETEGLLPDDEQLRAVPGERIITESSHFSLMVKVSAPREVFDRDIFIARVAKKYKIPAASLAALAEQCYASSKAPLSRKVLEV